MSRDEVELLKIRLARAESRIQILEHMIEDNAHEIFVAHEASRVANQFLTGVQDTLPVSLLVLLPDNTITKVNQSTRELSGYEEMELLGMNAERLFSPDFLVSAHASPSGYHRETTSRSKSGTMVPVLMDR